MRIYRYKLDPVGVTGVFDADLVLPRGAKLLNFKAGLHGTNDFHVWALVNPSVTEHVKRRLVAVFTGADFDPGESTYVGTAVARDLVIHLFDFGEQT